MIYIVKHPKWHGALNALHREPGRHWDNLMNSGYVSDSVAEEMVTAGIAVYDTKSQKNNENKTKEQSHAI